MGKNGGAASSGAAVSVRGESSKPGKRKFSLVPAVPTATVRLLGVPYRDRVKVTRSFTKVIRSSVMSAGRVTKDTVGRAPARAGRVFLIQSPVPPRDLEGGVAPEAEVPCGMNPPPWIVGAATMDDLNLVHTWDVMLAIHRDARDDDAAVRGAVDGHLTHFCRELCRDAHTN